MEKFLPEICTIQYGFPFDSAKFSTSEGMPLIRIRDVVRGYSETFTTEEYKEEYIVSKDDLLIGMDGEFNIAKWGETPALLNQRVCRLFPTSEVDKNYLFYFMPSALKRIEEKTPFVTVKHLSAKELNKVKVPLPPLDEQRRIATVLDKVSDLIAKRREQLDKLDELVKARFVEMFGDVASNPNGYPIKNFDEVSILITDGEHATPRRTDKGIYLLSARNVLNHKLQLDDVDYIDEKEYNRISRRIIPQAGDVLISCSGSIGRCCTVPDGLKFQMVRSAALIRFDESTNPVFAEWLITSDDLQQQIAQSATQSSQANLFQGKIRKLRGFIPPIELQNQFVDFVVQTDKSKLTIQQSLDKLEVLKKALMQQYFG